MLSTIQFVVYFVMFSRTSVHYLRLSNFLGKLCLNKIVYLDCRTRVTLKKDGVVLDLVPPPTKVSNLIFGRTWIDSPGEMVVTNMTTGDKVVLYFQPCGWFGYVFFLLNLQLISSDMFSEVDLWLHMGKCHRKRLKKLLIFR